MTIDIHNDGEMITIGDNSIERMVAMDISYIGTFHGECLLPPGWTLMANSFRIIAFNMGSFNAIQIINYTGNFNLLNVVIGDSNMNLHQGNLIERDIDLWELKGSSFDSDTNRYEDYNKDKTITSNILRTQIVTNNLLANNNEFFYSDGSEYNGDYHQHEDLQAMSGAKHTKDSVNIYRKNANGKLITPKSYKRSPNLIRNIKNIHSLAKAGREKENASDWSPSQVIGKQSGSGTAGGSGGGTY